MKIQVSNFIFIFILSVTGCANVVDFTYGSALFGTFRVNDVGGLLTGYRVSVTEVDNTEIPEPLMPGEETVNVSEGRHSVVARYYGDGSFTAFGEFDIDVIAEKLYYFEAEVKDNSVLFFLKMEASDQILDQVEAEKVPLKTMILIL